MNGFHLSEEQQYCLQELINIAMGQASEQLARYLNTPVYLTIPSIESVVGKELINGLSKKESATAIVSQGFFGSEGVRGEALLTHHVDNSGQIADLLGYEPEELSHHEQLIDISSIFMTTFLNTFASQIENKLSYNAPKLLLNIHDHIQQIIFSWDHALKVNINYQVTDYSFNCNMMLLIPEMAIMNIKKVIDKILVAC